MINIKKKVNQIPGIYIDRVWLGNEEFKFKVPLIAQKAQFGAKELGRFS